MISEYFRSLQPILGVHSSFSLSFRHALSVYLTVEVNDSILVLRSEREDTRVDWQRQINNFEMRTCLLDTARNGFRSTWTRSIVAYNMHLNIHYYFIYSTLGVTKYLHVFCVLSSNFQLFFGQF